MKVGLLAGLLLVCGGAAAQNQNPYIAPLGAQQTETGVAVSQPASPLEVDVTVEREVTLTGPYARYAQKFLGVSAPLTNKTVWSVSGASVSLLDAASLTDSSVSTSPSGAAASDETLPLLQADKNDMTVLSLEDAARQAATTLFALRRSRMDLITGEAGENVFGGGLDAALAEIARQEQSYLELFVGKRITTTEMRRFTVYPRSDTRQYIVCRFSAADGLLSAGDLSGDMVLLQIEPSGNISTPAEASSRDTNTVQCRVADPSACSVSVGGREYVREVLPLFEFGRTINVAVPRKK